MSVAEVEELVSQKYEIKKRLGKGAYGIVWKAIDRRTGEIVAVKKIFDAFRNRTDAQRTFREIMFLQLYDYTKGVDMWSIGCILGEMLLGKPLFPGTSTVNQIEQILSVIPAPSQEDILAIHSDYRASVINRISSRRRVTIEEILPSSTPPYALDLLKRLLVFNPDKRLTAEEALQHPYVKRFHCPAKEPSLDYDVILPLDDDIQLSVAEYRNKLYEMILERKANNRQQKQIQRENLQPSPSQFKPSLPNTSSVPYSTIRDQKEPRPTLMKSSHVPAGPTILGEVSSQREDLAGTLCQRPKINMLYNPITHTTVQNSLGSVVMARNHSAPLPQHQRTSSINRKHGRQITWMNMNAQPPATSVQNPYNDQQVPKDPDSQGQSVSNQRSFSLSSQAQEAAIHNHLTRKDSPMMVGVTAASTRLNPRNPQFPSRDAHPLLKSSKKMFQVTANMGAAGDPKASMGSYSQSYGTICKSALQNLPISNSYQQAPALNTHQH
ncbi:mitogen-activated protein kinase 15 [Terrapene carolina triunguis]|nr:mitogen-activated protein kinase 15 [Terrapene carolina triunguis]